jgi:putative Holliday junction resolvase
MALRLPSDGNVLGIDYGENKTGLALAGAVAKLPKPFGTIGSNGVVKKIKELIKTEDIRLIAVGLPKSLEGNETSQSRSIRQFADGLKKEVAADVVFADETLSSVRAEEYIKDNGLPPEMVDSIAACFILEELFEENGS